MVNLVLLEAQDRIDYSNKAKDAIKSKLNVCKLAKFKSQDTNDDFYKSFFYTTTDKYSEEMTCTDWINVYMELISDDTFNKNLGYFLSSYYPSDYSPCFSGIEYTFDIEYAETKNKILLINKVNAGLYKLQIELEALFNTVIPQVIYDNRTLTFKSAIIQRLETLIKKYKDLLTEITTANIVIKPVNLKNDVPGNYKDDYINDGVIKENYELSEEGKLLLEIFNKEIELNEGVGEKIKDGAKAVKSTARRAGEKISTAGSNIKEGVKTVAIGAKKMEETFDRKVTEVLDEMRANRRKRKHSEMVGESVKLSNTLKRMFKILPIYLINPAVGAMVYIVSVIIDKRTDKKDKEIIVGDLKLEIKIIDEKIATAERNNDEKEKVQLMRAKDKLERQLERIKTNRTFKGDIGGE